jgi:hypothetical protein
MSNSSLFFSLKNFMKHIRTSFGSQLRPYLPASKGPPAVLSHTPASVNKSVSSVSTIMETKSIHVHISADIPKGTTVHIKVEVVDEKGESFSQDGILTNEDLPKSQSAQTYELIQEPPTKPGLEPNSGQSVQQKPTYKRLEKFLFNLRKNGLLGATNWHPPVNIFFIGSIAIYAFVVSFGIDRYPIYFFTDEAIHMNMASDFLRDGFQNYYHEFLPTFFSAEGWVNGISVYVQILPYLLFGKSIIATRLVSASITLLGALALGLLLKQVFKIKYYWAGVLLLLTTPAWFLHARTAFEYAEVASFYIIFLYFYSRYRGGELRFLYGAIFAGALAFYTHGLGQILMGATGLVLFIVDFRYHIHPDRRKTVLYGLGLGIILLLPFVRYYFTHSNEVIEQIKRRSSYWSNDNLTIVQKIEQFFNQYTYGLNPRYWYFQNSVDIERHIMKGYGNGLLITLPFAFIGFIIAIKNIRQFPYRISLIAFLAVPLPASIVAIGMPRMLWMAIPLAILTTLGLSYLLEQLEFHWKKLDVWLPSTVFTLLTLFSLFMLRDALVNGPTWFEDYGLYGMQYGAKQVFEETIVPELENNPDTIFVVSPSWANGTGKFADFFIPKSLLSRVSFGQPIDQITDNAGITPNMRFVTTPNEYNNLLKDAKFKDIVIHKIIPYPNDKSGFYFLSVSTAANISEIFAEEKVKNRTPVKDFVQLDGQEISVIHSPFGSGDLNAVFDHNPDSLARVLEANPFTFDMYPTTSIDTHSVILQTGSLPDFTITISLYAPGAAKPIIYTKTFKDLPPDPLVAIAFDKGPTKSAQVYVEIKDNLSGESSQIHVRTLEFK